ncbi:hypothetical protein DVH24_025871 [Malus domestica]|uniref:Uncharacterized protein n=1 Tax=Malus domestica TaxID=3750 RepID=A0A498KLU6_MALDO|nr:hypothetical protein DVH24_025871 [Malus domestica]
MHIETFGLVFEFADEDSGSFNDSIGKGPTILSALGPDHVLTVLFLGTHTKTSQWVTHHGSALARYSLNFGVPMEPEASELPKGLVLGRDENIHLRITPLGDVRCYNPPPLVCQRQHALILGSGCWEMTDPNISSPFTKADELICSILPESPTPKSVTYSPGSRYVFSLSSYIFYLIYGGLLFRPGRSNLQHSTSLSVLLVYAGYMEAANKVVNCGKNVVITPDMLMNFTEEQVDYIL